MRIIAGKYKGRRISPPSGLDVRPTTDFAKEALFSIFKHRRPVEDARVLELFAGTGNVTFEFASHGASSVLAVEKDQKKTAFIKKTAALIGIDTIQIIKQDVARFLKTTNGKFDIIFADPPFDLEWLTEIPELVFSADLLDPDGWLIVEHGQRTDFSRFDGFIEKRTYGNVNFSIFSKTDS